MARFFMFLFLAGLVLAAISLISCLSAEEGKVRGLPRFAWVLIILLFPLVGSIAYLVAGRPLTAHAGRRTWRPGAGFPEATRPKRVLAPDDDPEFLNKIDRKTARENDDLFRKWEQDLKAREDELRKREGTKEEPPASDG